MEVLANKIKPFIICWRRCPLCPGRKQLSDNTDIYQKHPYLFATNHCGGDKGHYSVTGVQTRLRIKLEIMKISSRKT